MNLANLFGADDIGNPHPARRSDPETSHAAADRVKEFRASHHKIIHDILLDRVDGIRVLGLTVHEIASYSKLTAHEVGKRMAEGQGKMYALVLGEDGKPVTRSSSAGGRACRIWRPLA